MYQYLLPSIEQRGYRDLQGEFYACMLVLVLCHTVSVSMCFRTRAKHGKKLKVLADVVPWFRL